MKKTKKQEVVAINLPAVSNRENELHHWVAFVSKGALERDIRPFPVRYFTRVVTNLVNACWDTPITDAKMREELVLAGLVDAENRYTELQSRALAEVRKMHFPDVAAAEELDIVASALWFAIELRCHRGIGPSVVTELPVTFWREVLKRLCQHSWLNRGPEEAWSFYKWVYANVLTSTGR